MSRKLFFDQPVVFMCWGGQGCSCSLGGDYLLWDYTVNKTDDINGAAKLSLCCSDSEYKMAEHFSRLTTKKQANYWLKTARTARREFDGRHLLFGEYLQN